MTTDTGSVVISRAGTDPDWRAHMSDHMSTRPQRIEVILRSERRRRWSLEQKQSIVAESLAANVSMPAIARKHGIGTGQLYGWCHQLLGSRPAEAAGFARVALVGEPRRLAGPVCVPSASYLSEKFLARHGASRIRLVLAAGEQEPRWNGRLDHLGMCAWIKGGCDPRTDGCAQDGMLAPAGW